jgi:hypothetical protein
MIKSSEKSHFTITWPASTTIVWPVIILDFSEAGKTTASAMS